MNLDFTPGMLVRNPSHPEWGLGQVQSAVGDRVTANFENAGKVTLNLAVVTLETVDEPLPPPGYGR
ncbi:MAG: DUF3553 domain-containing protein [Rhodospirillaceae bacterium]|nr:DUF3553 domain-containing protein [Rhodospirillaceae bacterium]